MTFNLVASSLAIGLTMGPGLAQAQSTSYSFTRIADSLHNPGFTKPLCAGLNERGTVSVNFTPVGSATMQLWRSSGGVFLLVAPAVLGCSSINDLDEFAYMAYEPGTSRRLLVRNSNGVPTTLASSDVPPYLSSATNVGLPSLNNNGRVLYVGGTEFRPSGIYMAPGAIPVFPDTTGALTFMTGTLNDSDTAVFAELRLDATAPLGTRAAIHRGSVVPLIEEYAAVPGGILTFGVQHPVMNASGTVAFFGNIDDSTTYALTTSDGLSVEIVGTGGNLDGLAINDAGTVAFSRRRGGIYIGRPGAINQKVIKPGDPLDGSIVEATALWPEGINGKGQIAFYAKLKDGRHGVYRADPIALAALSFTHVVPGCEPIVGLLKLLLPAPAGGVTVSIASSNPAASVPESVFVPEGRSAATFTITPTPVLADTAGDITLRLDGTTLSRSLTVRPIELHLLHVRSYWVAGATVFLGAVWLDCGPAPYDLTVTLSSSRPDVLQPDVSSLLFEGNTSARSFTLTRSAPTEPTEVVIRASANGVTKTRKIIVNPD